MYKSSNYIIYQQKLLDQFIISLQYIPRMTTFPFFCAGSRPRMWFIFRNISLKSVYKVTFAKRAGLSQRMIQNATPLVNFMDWRASLKLSITYP